MKVIKWWKLSSDESYLVMKVKEIEIAKEVKRSDGWWRFASGDVFYKKYIQIFVCIKILYSSHPEWNNEWKQKNLNAEILLKCWIWTSVAT